MPTPTIYRSLFPTLQKAVVDESAMSVVAVLTYPGVDKAGDIVRSEGLNFALHAHEPWIDLEHNGQPIAWARKSLGKPGQYSVQHSNLDIEGKPHTLPIGTSYFDSRDRLSSQVFDLIARDALPGVSLEFRAVPGFFKALGQSPLENRPAYDFLRADVVRWCHCAVPVNPGAQTVTKSLAATDPLMKILSDGKIGDEDLHPTIKKALSVYMPSRKSFPVGKAMNLDDPDTTSVYDTPEVTGAETPEATPDEAPATPTVQAHYDVAQGLIDLCEQARGSLQSSEHMKGKQYLLKLIDKVEAMAEDAKANGDKIDGEIAGGKEPTDDEPVGDTIEKDDDGTMKAIRPVYKKAIKRFTMKEVTKGIAGANPAVEAEIAEVTKRLARKLKRW